MGQHAGYYIISQGDTVIETIFERQRRTYPDHSGAWPGNGANLSASNMSVWTDWVCALFIQYIDCKSLSRWVACV